ncbi:MAG: ATP-binding cassette domain-containing protein [Bacilli bacterium]|jgi:ABC-2 type transport system ATP-binding protein|nr:ATP-binding cassette domain-containing protein [Bacilli bacterium]
MLKVENITKYYNKTKAVDNLSFTVEKGEIFGLLGENGAGKTTTFRIILGLINASSGNVTLDGKKIDYSLTDKIGYVTEERSLLTKMTVKDQILLYGVLKGMSEDNILKEMRKWLKKFQILDYENRKIKELSKGNQQKIQFIAAVINKPKLLILDEPFSGLDPINVEMLKKAIIELQETGCSIIFSSHQMEQIEDFCEKLVILSHGKVVVAGYLKDIKNEYRKKNILLRGDNLPLDKIRKLKGVISLEEHRGEYLVKIESLDIADSIFKIVKDYNITKYDVTEPTLNEIFIEKVGANND